MIRYSYSRPAGRAGQNRVGFHLEMPRLQLPDCKMSTVIEVGAPRFAITSDRAGAPLWPVRELIMPDLSNELFHKPSA